MFILLGFNLVLFQAESDTPDMKAIVSSGMPDVALNRANLGHTEKNFTRKLVTLKKKVVLW